MRYFLTTLFLLFQLILPAAAVSVKIDIKGLDNNIALKLLSGLSLKNGSNIDIDDIDTQVDILESEVTTSLQALGWYQAEINTKKNITDDRLNIVFAIIPNKPILIRDVTISLDGINKQDRNLIEFIEKNKLLANTRFKHVDYENLKLDLLAHAQAIGYLDANFKHNIVRVIESELAADIELILAPGERYKFGVTSFEGSKFDDKQLNKLLTYKNGDFYSLDKLEDMRSSILGKQIFKQVIIEQKEANDFFVPIKITLAPPAKHKYTASLGYGTNTQLRATAGWQYWIDNRVGHRLNSDIFASHRILQGQIQYSLPGKKPLLDQINIGLRAREENFDESYSLLFEVGVNSVQKRGSTIQRFKLRHLSEFNRTTIGNPKQESYFLLPSASIQWMAPHKIGNITVGHSITFGIEAGVSFLLSSTSFVQPELTLKHIFGLDRNTRILFHEKIGISLAKNFDEIPLSLRYFAGGDNSVRGFGFRSIGPSIFDPEVQRNITVGGRNILLAGVEIERNLTDRISIASFIDLGDARNSLKTSPAAGAGLGIRFATPLGKLRFDVARALNKVDRKKLRFHITFGPDL